MDRHACCCHVAHGSPRLLLPRTARLWRTLKGSSLDIKLEHKDRLNAVCVTPGAKFVITACDDRSAHIWSLEPVAKTPLRSLAHAEIVRSVSVTTDGQHVVTVARDRLRPRVRVWRFNDGSLERELEGHTHAVLSACVTPKPEPRPAGSNFVVTTSQDCTARVWPLCLFASTGTAAG